MFLLHSYAPGQQEEWVIFSAYRQLMQFHVKHAMSHWFLLFLLATLIMVFHVRACGQGFWSYFIFQMSHCMSHARWPLPGLSEGEEMFRPSLISSFGYLYASCNVPLFFTFFVGNSDYVFSCACVWTRVLVVFYFSDVPLDVPLSEPEFSKI